MRETTVVWASVVAAAWLAGCGSSTTIAPVDAGAGEDALAPVDAAAAPDGGALEDAAPETDAASPPTDAARPDTGPRDASAPDVGSVLPPVDGGNPFGDAGALGDPAWVPLTVLTDGSTCPPLVACGGDVTGTWDVSGGCFAVDLSAIDRCPTASASATGQARGRVTFDGTTARRVAQSEVDVQIFVPALCARFVPGGCAAIETQIQAATPDAACTTQTDMSCLCQARQLNVIDDTDRYTTTATQIVGTAKRWDYCIAGDALRYEDATPSGPREPGIIDLTRR